MSDCKLARMVNLGQDMDVRAESEGKPSGGTGKTENRRLDLSVAQVAGSALAAVAAAVLASRLGVYGTIIGAGVVSVVATAGGPVFQHLFRRTGEQLKEAAAQTRPRPGATRGGALRPRPAGEYGEATTHGTRLRGWKRAAVPAGAAFVLAMGAVTGVELLAGGPVSNLWGGDHGGTTVSNSVSRSSPQRPAHTPGTGSPSPGDGRSTGPATAPSAEPHRPDRSRPSGRPDRDGAGTARPEPGGGSTGGAENGGTEGTTAPAPAPAPSGGATAPEGPVDPTPGQGGDPAPAIPAPAPTGADAGGG